MKNEDRDDAAILSEARERLEYCFGVDADNRKWYREDFEFVYKQGSQWASEIKQTRASWKEPCLEFNQLKQFVNQVVNDMRQGRPGIKVIPANGEASEDTAELIRGLVRGIENDSRAESVYDNAFRSAVVGGRGYWRICSDYVDGASFDQKLKVEPIPDALCVYSDMDYREPDASDKSWYLIVEKVHKDEFARQWPDAEPISFSDPDSKSWIDGEFVIVADYYRRVCVKRRFVMMSDGASGYQDEMPKPPHEIQVVRERMVETYKVEWHKIAGGQQILETYEWPGSIIPVVQTIADETILEGRRLYQGLIRHARDAQSMFNFGMTQQAVRLALSPKAPWVAAAEAIEGYEETYRNANMNNYSVLPFHSYDDQGRALPPPSRTQPAMVDVGFANFCNDMTGMIKSTIGMYENSLSQRGNETSGRAIIAKEKQGDNATFHLIDNLAKAIALTGRILVECIPHYYDSQRIVHIIGNDDIRKMVTINQTSVDGALNAIRLNDVTVGEYAVVVESGPSYATKRQETSDKMLSLVNSFPPIAQVAADLIVKSMDVEDADQIADRLKLALPPNIQAAEQMKAGGMKPPDPQVMQQMMQMQQQLQQANQAMAQMRDELEKAQSGVQAKIQSAQIAAQSDATVAQINADVELKKANIAAQVALEKTRIAEDGKLRGEFLSATTSATPVMAQNDDAAENTMAAAAISAANQLSAVLSQLSSVMSAPKNLSLTLDERGNVIGGVSSPMPQTVQ